MRIVIILILVLTHLGCVMNKGPEYQQQEQARVISLFDQICQVEEKRHGDRGTMDSYRNSFTDAYQENPGEPKLLVAYLKQTTNIACRGALLQLLCRTHPQYFAKNWASLDRELSTEDYRAILNGIRFIQADRPEEIVLSLLGQDYRKEVRQDAALVLKKIDQKRYTNRIIELINAEKDSDVLLNILFSLDLDNLKSYNKAMKGLFNHPDKMVHQAIITNWSMSDLPEKQEWIQNYSDKHPLEEVRAMAESFLASLEDEDKLELKVSMGQIDSQQHDNQIDPELEQAIYHEKRDRVALLLNNGANPNATDENLITPLMLAASRRDGSMVPILLEYGARVELLDNNKRNALFYAAMAGYTETVQLLLDRGLDQELRDVNGLTARDLADMLEFEEVVNLLKSPQPQSAEDSPLHLALAAGDIGKIIDLLDEGAPVDQRNSSGRTPLMEAARAGNQPLAKLFVARGARVGARDPQGMKATTLAINEGHGRTFEYLREAEFLEAARLALVNATAEGDLELTRKILAEGAPITARTQQGRSLLHEAILNGYRDMVVLLLAHGADAGEQIAGRSLADYARDRKLHEIADLLDNR